MQSDPSGLHVDAWSLQSLAVAPTAPASCYYVWLVCSDSALTSRSGAQLAVRHCRNTKKDDSDATIVKLAVTNIKTLRVIILNK